MLLIYFLMTISKIGTKEKLWSHIKITTLIHQNILCIKNKYTVIIFLVVLAMHLSKIN